MNRHFPIFMDLSRKNILFVGAGEIAARRLKTMLMFDCKPKVIAEKIGEKVAALIKEYGMDYEERKFKEDDIKEMDMVFACTDKIEVNSLITALAKERGILYNSCTDKSDCSFYFPSVIVDDNVCIAVNAGGENHLKVKETRLKLEKALDFENKLRY